MKNSIVFLSLLFLFAPLAHAGETGSDSAKETAATEPMQFDKYWMVFLVRPEAPKDHGKERDAELQREHLAHLTWLWEERSKKEQKGVSTLFPQAKRGQYPFPSALRGRPRLACPKEQKGVSTLFPLPYGAVPA